MPELDRLVLNHTSHRTFATPKSTLVTNDEIGCLQIKPRTTKLSPESETSQAVRKISSPVQRQQIGLLRSWIG
jgi:hypothetical protein